MTDLPFWLTVAGGGLCILIGFGGTIWPWLRNAKDAAVDALDGDDTEEQVDDDYEDLKARARLWARADRLSLSCDYCKAMEGVDREFFPTKKDEPES